MGTIISWTICSLRSTARLPVTITHQQPVGAYIRTSVHVQSIGDAVREADLVWTSFICLIFDWFIYLGEGSHLSAAGKHDVSSKHVGLTVTAAISKGGYFLLHQHWL